MLTYTEAVPLVMQLVINFPQPHVARELAALAVNLSLNARNASAWRRAAPLRARRLLSRSARRLADQRRGHAAAHGARAQDAGPADDEGARLPLPRAIVAGVAADVAAVVAAAAVDFAAHVHCAGGSKRCAMDVRSARGGR